MLAIERRNDILEKLKLEQKVLVGELSKIYSVSEETIRRDLEKLEQQGVAKKTYGGAVLVVDSNKDQPYRIRKDTNVKDKIKVAQIVAKMINDGDCIAIDSSSTSVYIIKAIKAKNNITVITNSIEILCELSDKEDWKVLSTGGNLRVGALSLVGHQAEKMLKNFHVDKAIVSCKGVDLKHGLTDAIESEAEVKKHMLDIAAVKILAVDNSKFDKTSFATIDDFSVIDVCISNEKPNQDMATYCKNNDITYKFE